MADDKKNDEDLTDADAPGTEPTDAQTDTAVDATGEGAETDSETVVEAERMSDLDTDAVIEAFGGIRPMASKLGVAVSTVQGWKTRGHIPENRWRDIITAAGAHGVDLSAALSPVGKADDGTDTAGSATSRDPESPWENAGADAEAEAEAERYGTSASETPRDETEPRATAASNTQSPAPPPAARKGGGGLALLIGLAALAAVVARPLWAPYVDPHIAAIAPQLGLPAAAPPSGAPGDGGDGEALASALADLRARLSALEARPSAASGDSGGEAPGLPADLAERIAGLESDLSAVQDAASEMRTLNAQTQAALEETRNSLAAVTEREEGTRTRLIERLGVLEGRVDRIATEAERAASGLAGLRQRIEEQSDEIAALEARPAIAGAAQAGIALAVGDVESALASGRPFSGAIDRIVGLAGPDGAVTRAARGLAPLAAAGVPTEAALLSRFQEMAPTMQSESGQGGDDVLETLARGAQSLISIRRKGEAPDDPPVSRAEAALERGDLASAVAALTPLRDRSEAAADWLAAAEARLAAEAALADLRAAAADRISGARDGSTPEESTPEGSAPEGAAQDEGAATEGADGDAT